MRAVQISGSVETSEAVMLNAIDLTVDDKLRIWDSIVLLAEAGCRSLLSEDLQEGFTWRGVTITNPFATNRHALLGAVLARPQDRSTFARQTSSPNVRRFAFLQAYQEVWRPMEQSRDCI